MQALLVGLLTAVVLLVPVGGGEKGMQEPISLRKLLDSTEYAYLEHKIYRVFKPGDATNWFVNFARESPRGNAHYVFVGCPGEVRFLSPEHMADFPALTEAEFVGPKDRRYQRLSAYYTEKCWSKLAITDQAYKHMAWIKGLMKW